jgi:hypothetical protein
MRSRRGVAQLGLARSVRDAEAEGSNPSSPTIDDTHRARDLPVLVVFGTNVGLVLCIEERAQRGYLRSKQHNS